VATRQAIGRRRRVRARVEGTVQGVGFRPFVHRLAGELELGGLVLNDARGVQVEVEGDPAAVERFLERLAVEAPPLAVVERVSSSEVQPAGETDFEIASSDAGGERLAQVAADAATCAACLAELFDPTNRRYRYPFINCTDCGPRFTIVAGVPYDRTRTTMDRFEMCSRCRAEYVDPADRRFHAEPNACPDCGPRARLLSAYGEPQLDHDDPVAAAAAALRRGAVVAVKGLGGYHLACRADDDRAVAELRHRKRREEKPFALMVPDLAAGRNLVELCTEEELLLGSRERPIVLARRRPDSAVAPAVAPGASELGLMLPYSPLHHLLLADAGTTLVMTSGNASDEPIAYRDDDALQRLAGIADLFLVHDRPVETRTEDSVVGVVRVPQRAREASEAARRPLLLRRSRGYVPDSIPLAIECEAPILACGAELKNTFCLLKEGRAWVGPHIGDLRGPAALQSFREGIDHFERLFAVTPRLCAHDLHPDYLSTRYALEREGVEPVGVQHHHAHLAACLAEHGLAGPAIGAIYDGTGYGTDGTVWGGEILVGGLSGFERAATLWRTRMPGGEAAIRQPWRMACAWLTEALGEEPPIPSRLRDRVEARAWQGVSELARSGLSSPLTTSVGRLFDAVAALCGIRATVSYEGQAAFELQAACDDHEPGAYPLPALDGLAAPSGVDESAQGSESLAAPGQVLDARVTVAAILDDLEAGVPVPQVAARFHNGLAQATADACAVQAQRHDLELVVLSGGVFQNRLLLERTAEAVARTGLQVLVPRRLPPNDGGISYGQAAAAAAQLSFITA
jgi:hydrogenase maturation protein HypF